MKKTIILTRGIPASGKSTWAYDKIKEPNWTRVNKDDIREALHNGVWSKSNEKEVVTEERAIVENDMGHKLNIIVDNTHLGLNNPHVIYYRKLAEENGYEFEIKDFYVSRKEAIERDKAREESVGVEVIDRMIKQSANGGYPPHPTYREYQDGEKIDAYIFDIDGTLAHMKDKRSPYDYSKVDGDEINLPLSNLLWDLSLTNDIIILSGREDSCEKETRAWLEKHNIPYSELCMRKEGDTRKDSIIKKEIFDNELFPKYNVLGAFDDRNQVVDMWRLEAKIPCYQVWYGNF